MASTVSVKIEGLEGIKQAMKDISNEVNKRIARSATLAGSQIVKEAAIKNAPVLTGNLKKNIILKRNTNTNLTSEFLVTVRQGKRTKKQITQGLGDAFYAKFVEYGTVKMAAQPFIRPAFDNNKEAAANAIIERLKTGIARATK
jgi:HK97 gp10 family phage protein